MRKEAAQARYPDLAERVAVVTGGASGIGEAIVRALVGQGVKVGFIDMDGSAGAALAESLAGAREGGVHFETADLRDISALQDAIARIGDRLGAITILVNNAARDDRHRIDEVTPDYWRERMATNIDHQFFAAQAVQRQMAGAGGGSIICMGSTSYMASRDSFAAYKTAKSATIGLTRALARELGPANIRVNCLVPGWIMTQRQIDMWLSPEGEAELLKQQCLKRKLVPDDIARPVLFLASQESSAMTAQTMIVDGGWV